MKLTSQQEEIVRNYVEDQGLKLTALKDDIIDHLCCVIESGLGKAKPFEHLLEDAANDLAPEGLMAMENKTMFLLNSKRIIIMKKLTYLIGFIGSLALTVGVTFKLLHMPGANMLFSIGYLTLFMAFIPLLAVDRYKVAIARVLSEKLKIILGVGASILLGLAGLFKIMHLQGADTLLLIGAAVFAVGFLPFYFFTMYKKAIA